MACFEIAPYSRISSFDFESLPKGCMFSLTMNPYTGRCFLSLEKHSSSTVIAFDVLKEVVHACEILSRAGSNDPLRDFLSYSVDGCLVQELTKAAASCSFVKLERGNSSVVLGGNSQMVS